MKTADFVLYSDGGGERRGAGGGGCIIEEAAWEKRIKFACFLGGATNNESELCAGLLGFSFLRAKTAHPSSRFRMSGL